MAVNLTAVGAVAGLLTARHAVGSLTMGGIDLLAGLASQSLLSFSYTDNTSDKADDLSIVIADPARTWMQTYLPKKGVEGEAAITVYNWIAPGDSRMIDCGTFVLDQIDFAGPPNTVSIKATSVPVGTGIKTQKKYGSWEGVTLPQIALEIATRNGLTLVWDTAKAIFRKLKRVDQVEMPDLEFIRDKAKEASLSIKVYKRQLVLYSEEEYEARPPAYVIAYGASNIIGYTFSSKLDDTYKKANVTYTSPESGDLIEGTYEADEPPEGTEAVEERNERVEEPDEGAGGNGGGPPGFAARAAGDIGTVDYSSENAAAADAANQLAKSKLREKNKHEKEATITVVGNPGYLSGLNVQLLGFGIFDGKWFITSSTHSIDAGGYMTELKMRGALSGY